jgi:serine/threonine-protein kinase
VRAESAESISLIFSLWQEGGQIASVTHRVQVTRESPQAVIQTGSHTVPVEDAQPVTIGSSNLTYTSVGKTLGPYQIVEEMGRGGMAVVYKAYQSSLQRYVALKVISERFTQDATLLKRLEQQMHIAAQLRHPNIMLVYDWGQEGALFFIVTEYLEGQPLDVLLQQAPLPLGRVANIMAQVAAALDYAHSKGLVHRDVRPSNIIVDEKHNDHVVLTDLSLTLADWGSTVTGAGVMIGTPEYMSPEQAKGEDIDLRTDIYSLGVVLYQMLTGSVPFVRSTPMAVVLAHVTDPPPSVSQLNPDVPQSVEAIVLKAMAKNRTERYQSAGSLASDLNVAITERITSGRDSSLEPVPPPSRTPQTGTFRPIPPPLSPPTSSGTRPQVEPPTLPPVIAGQASQANEKGCRPALGSSGWLILWVVLIILILFCLGIGMVLLMGIVRLR